jgi:oligopeptide transport system ATP-binding protein
VDEGEVLGLAGESGCGKSVTCQAVMGLVVHPGKITGGQVMFCGQDLLKKNDTDLSKIRGSQIAIIFQDPLSFLNPVLTIGDQVEEPLRFHMKMNAKQARTRAIELLSMVGIPSPQDCLNAYPYMFSGGMRQRVMIAMALSCNPKLLIADEPTTALDVTVQMQIIELIKKLQQEINMSVIWITHDLGILAGIAKRINIMYAGYLIESNDVDDFYANPLHPYSSGLLKSIPRMDKIYDGELNSIPGNPPIITKQKEGCPFFSRCNRSVSKCQNENPKLVCVNDNRQVACWEAYSLRER